MKSRFGFPHPLLSVALLLVWTMLAGTSVGFLLLGLVLAWILPLLTRRFWPDTPTIQKPWKLLPYTLKVIWDIIIASITVAKLVLSFGKAPKPAFVCYPLTLTHPMGITVLASTISLTPGTVSADVSDDHTMLLIHAVDVEDDQELINSIHNRYEKALMEVFT